MAGGALFPLPSNFFPSMELSAEEAASFQEWGDRLLQETVDSYHRDQLDSRDQKERKWKVLKQRGGLTAFRRRKSAGDDDYKYLTTGIIEGSLDEVVRGRYADNTDDFRRVSAVYRDDLVDCAVLHTIERESPARPYYYSGFKWMTVQSPGKGLVKNRDVCWYEQVGLTRDRNGKEIGYTLTESVDLPNCPTFSDCVRAKLSVCYLYRRNKSGGVKVYMRGRNNAGGKVMDYIADQKSAELWLRVDRSMAVTQAAIATAFVELSKTKPRMNFEKKKCEICEDRIGTIMSSTKQCAMCHRFTCTRCIVKKRVLSPLVDFKAVCRENFCKKCLRFITDVNLRDPASLQDVWHFATSTLGDSAQRSYVRPFESDRGTDSSRDTDEAQSVAASTARTRSVAESVSSDGSDRSFRQLPPPPTIAARPMQLKQHQLPPTMQHYRGPPKKPSSSSASSSASSSSRSGQANMHLLHHNGSSMPGAPVTLYEGTGRVPSGHSTDGYGNQRHVPQYAGSPVTSGKSSSHHSHHGDYYGQPSFASDYSYAQTTSTRSTSSHGAPSEYAESYQPLTSSALQGHNQLAGYQHHRSTPPTGYTPDAMMAQMIKMNIMAEKAQAMVEHNDRVARGVYPPQAQRY